MWEQNTWQHREGSSKKKKRDGKKKLAVCHLAEREGDLITLNKAVPSSKSNL